MEIQASLQCIHLTSPQPQALADFYTRCYGMHLIVDGPDLVCQGPGRTVAVSHGAANQLLYAQFGLNGTEAWAAFAARTSGLAQEPLPQCLAAQSAALAFRDPDGNLMVFTRAHDTSALNSDAPSRAVSQHFALRTTRVPEMQAFYRDQLGFVVSDEVKDESGILRACFLRTDPLHHSLALFGAPVTCFDHQSFEAPNWDDMKRWGDHMAALRVPIVWGIGRHGPGNDLFFMVRDPDNNLAEISTEIETCVSERPTGQWPHEERTLNVWGKAIMRS
jgi:catechol 2,3-dioxygenase-like lactoylglutathione lyase family enzyme